MELFKCLVLFLSQNSIIKTIIGTCIPKKHAPQKEHVSAKRAGLFCTFISFFFFFFFFSLPRDSRAALPPFNWPERNWIKLVYI